MAKDVITRFKLETTGFDSKIKQAAKDLSAYSKTATQAKEGFNQFTKANVDAARALGSMATSTTNAKDKTKELVGAFNEAAKAYNQLSDEQKQSDWAKALAGSLTQLQDRIKETKQEMQGLGDGMKNIGGGGGSSFEDALSVFAGNMATKATGALMEIGNEVLNITKESMQLAAQAEGIETAFARLNNPGLLDGLRQATHGTVSDLELMKAAVKFNDFKLPVEELGTMLAFAQQKAKDTGQSVDYMVDSIVTGLGRKSVMILDNLGLSAASIKEKMKETGDMTTAVGAIIREQMAEAGDYVETAADRTTTSAVEMQNAMLEFGKTMREATGLSSWDELNNYLKADLIRTLNDVVTGMMKVNSSIVEAVNGVMQAFRPMVNTINGAKDAATSFGVAGSAALDSIKTFALGALGPLGQILNMFRLIGKEQSQFKDIKDQANDKTNGILDRFRTSYKGMFGGNKDNAKPIPTTTTTPKVTKTGGGRRTTGTRTGGGTPKVDNNYATDSIMAQEKEVARLTDLWRRAGAELRDSYLMQLEEAREELKKMNEGMSGSLDEVVVKASPELQMKNKQKTFSEEGLSEKSLGNYISGIKSVLSNTDIGSELYESINAQLADATGMQEVLQAAMDAGISGMNLDGIGTKMKEALLDGDIPEDMFNEILGWINKLREEAGKEPISLDFETGKLDEVKKDSMGVEDATIAAARAVNQVAGALENVEDPGVKAAAIVAEAIANIAASFAMAAKAPDTTASGWGWIAWLAAGAAALATTISTVHSLTGFAGGGVVEGNSYSGDNQLVRVNAGETILTRAQSGVIADALEGSAMSNLKLETYVSGRRLRIVMNNDLMARGQGKLVSSNTLKG